MTTTTLAKRFFFLMVVALGTAESSQVYAQRMSTICLFNAGPKAGTSHDYAPLNPLVVGTPCQDGISSSGVIAPKNATSSPPATTSGASSICEFTSGPLTGTTHDYSPMAALPVGSPCQDGAGSTGVVISGEAGADPTASVSDLSDDVTGDWQGALGGKLPLILHLRRDGGGTADSPAQNAFGMPLTYKESGKKLVVSLPTVRATFVAATMDSELTGTFSQNGEDTPLILTESPSMQPAENGDAVANPQIAGDWYGSLTDKLPLIFHFNSSGSGTVDSPAQNKYGIFLKYTGNQDTVTVSIPSVGATFAAAPDGDRMTGLFTQNGQQLSLLLRKN